MAHKDPNPRVQAIDITDKYIISGDLNQARQSLQNLLDQTKPRNNRQYIGTLAQLCRRVGWSDQAIRLLNPIVRPSGRKLIVGTTQEKAEYAASLTLIGAVPEALEILSGLSPKEEPQVALFKAFAHFARWEYGEAIPVLKSYLEDNDLSPYQRLIGDLNLCAALVASASYQEAIPKLQGLIQSAPDKPLLQINALEVLAQAHIFVKETKQAEKALSRADQLSPSGHTGYQLLLEKWNLIKDLYSGRDENSSLRKLAKVKKEAFLQRRWEVARDCDYYIARFSKNDRLAKQLLFGSPFPAYRNRIENEFGISPKLDDVFTWRPLSNKKGSQRLDTLRGSYGSDHLALKAGQSPHRLLRILFSDLYRPQRIGSLFSQLYPNEYFHPTYSVQRTQQVIIRLRKWLNSSGSGVHFSTLKKESQLFYSKPIDVQISLLPIAAEDMISQQFLTALESKRSYSVDEIASLLEKPRRSTQRYITQGIKKGYLEATGATRNRKYRRS